MYSIVATISIIVKTIINIILIPLTSNIVGLKIILWGNDLLGKLLYHYFNLSWLLQQTLHHRSV